MSSEDFYQKLLQQRQPSQGALYFFFKNDVLVYITRKLSCIHPHDSFTVLTFKGDLFDLEKKFIEKYKPHFNVQESNFNPFDYYRQHISHQLSDVQTRTIMQWKNTMPSELIKEAMDRVIAKCPDKPFGYLKYFMDDWSDKGYRTLTEIQQADEQHQSKYQKGSVNYAEHERNIEENGHYQGIAKMDF